MIYEFLVTWLTPLDCYIVEETEDHSIFSVIFSIERLLVGYLFYCNDGIHFFLRAYFNFYRRLD